MGEDDRVPPLSRRVPGNADWPSPPPRAEPPELPEQLLARMRAAVQAAHAEAARAQATEAEEARIRAAQAEAARAEEARSRARAGGRSVNGSAAGPQAPAKRSAPPWESAPPAAVGQPPGGQRIKPGPARQPGSPPEGQSQPAPGQLKTSQQGPGPRAGGQPGRPAIRRRRLRIVLVVAAVIAVAAIVAGSVGIAAAGRNHAARRGGGTTALSSEAALRDQAAAWVSAQVSRAADVSCDPVMCLALQAHGIPAGDLNELRPGSADPLGSDVIVSTAAVRSEFGARISSVYAPAVLASFGSGSARIDVRVIAAGGARAYTTALSADLAARKMIGGQLLRNSRVTVSAAARPQLAAGAVDSRLLIILATMSNLHPVSIAGFGGSGPGASPGVPLRFADLAAGPVTARAAYFPLAAAFLRAQKPPYQPALIQAVRLPDGQPALRVDFAAPSPLGLLASRGSGG
jgi:hypothetical protein